MRALMTPAKSASLLQLLAGVRALPGSIVELGVYQGATLKALAELCPEKAAFGFDTFTGLPVSGWRVGEVHHPGEFGDVSLATVAQAMPANVILFDGLFPESARDLGHDVEFCFAHVDFDFETGTDDAIRWLRPKMGSGGLIVFDDYRWPNCPGVERAIVRAGLTVVESAPYQAYWRAP